jgi:hypothetical protein
MDEYDWLMSSFLAAFPRIPANQFAKLPGKNRLLRSRYATHDETRFSLILSRIYALPCSSINNTHRSITWRFRITPIYKIFTNFDQHTHNLKAVGVFNTFSNYVPMFLSKIVWKKVKNWRTPKFFGEPLMFETHKYQESPQIKRNKTLKQQKHL